MTNTLYTRNSGLFDLFFRDFFNEDHFKPLEKIHYPTDIYEKEDGLYIDIVALDASAEDVEITAEDGDVLKVKYEAEETDWEEEILKFHSRNISRKNFNFGWKIPNRFNLSEIDANFDGGLIKLHIPLREESKPKKIKLNS